MSTIKVMYQVGKTSWSNNKILKSLEGMSVLGFDVETAGVYPKEERKKARELLKQDTLKSSVRKQCILIENNSGLSHPSLINTTHFIFGISSSESVVLVTANPKDELAVWKWVAKQDTLFVIHNAMFDLRIMHHRVGVFPKNYIDTALRAKCLINNADNYKSKVGLKILVGEYYKPAWSLYDEYEPDSLFNEAFIDYAATDGAAVYLLHELLQEEIE